MKKLKWPPLLFSAQAGHFEVSKFLYTEFEDKTIRTGPPQITAQHLAAKNGHLEIYKFLHEKSNEINPIMQEDITPLHLAAQHGHFDVCKYICDNTMMVAPIRSDSLTPIDLAQHRRHFKVAELLSERDAANIIVITTDELKLFMLQYLFICTCIFIAMEFFQYLSSGVSILFNGPIEIIDCLTIFLSMISPCILFAMFLIFLILHNIVEDVKFTYWTGPKLDY